MLCSKLHCQKGFNLIPFSYKIQAVDYDPINRSQLASTQWFLGPYVVQIWYGCYATRCATHHVPYVMHICSQNTQILWQHSIRS